MPFLCVPRSWHWCACPRHEHRRAGDVLDCWHLRKHHRALREYSPKPWGFACYLSEVTVQTMVYIRGKFIEFVSSPLIMSCFIYYFTSCPSYIMSFPGGSVVKNLPANAGDAGSIPQSERSPREGNGNPLQYSSLGNPTDRGAWQAAVYGVAKESDTT